MAKHRIGWLTIIASISVLLLTMTVTCQARGVLTTATSDTIQVIPTVLVFTIDQPVYLWNSVTQDMDVTPIAREQRILLPIRYIADPLGAQTSWDSSESKVTIKTSTKTIELWLNRNIARVNGAESMIDPSNPKVMPIAIPPGRTMMPLRFIADNLDCEVVWDNPSMSATISYPK